MLDLFDQPELRPTAGPASHLPDRRLPSGRSRALKYRRGLTVTDLDADQENIRAAYRA